MVEADKWLEKAEKMLEVAKNKGENHGNIYRLVYELRKHQAELEIQNEELKQSREELSKLYHQYHELYDDVPVGYFTLDENGIICNVNVKGAELLQLNKNEITGFGFGQFLSKDSEEIYYQSLARAIDTGENQELELQLKKDKLLFDAYMEIMPLNDKDDAKYRIIIIDVTRHKKSEEKILFQSNALSQISDAVIVIDNDNIITYWNKGAEDLYGYSVAEVMGKHLKETHMLKWVKPEELETILYKLDSAGYWHGETINFNRNKEKIHIDLTINPLKNDAGDQVGLLSISRDITEHKKAEKKLRESEARFHSLYENSYDSIILSMPDGSIIAANPAAERMFQMNEDEIIEAGLEGIVVFDENLKRFLEEREQKGKAKSELAFKRKDGSIFPGETTSILFKDAADTTNISMIISDITKRKKAEEKLFKNKEKFKFLSDAAISLLSSEKPEKIISHICNKALIYLDCDVFFNYLLDENKQKLHLNAYSGVSKSEISARKRLDLGEDISGFVCQDVCPIVAEDIQNTPDGRTEFVRSFGVQAYACHPIISKGQTLGTLSFGSKSKTFFRNDELELMQIITNYVATALERKYNEEELKNARDLLEKQVKERTVELKNAIIELERSNKELQQFAYVSSHDLQEPLRTIASFTQLLERRYKGQLDSDADEFMDYIVDAAVHMKSQIEALLEYSRVATKGEKFEMVDMNDILDQTILILGALLEESDVEITNDELPSVMGDSGQLQRVLQNLISNAIKFRKCEEQPRIHISAYESEDWKEYIFCVQDNGIGIQEQYLERIFVIFQRLHTRDVYKGTGIGLSLVKRIIERHGGRIWVESEPEVGSKFFFTLPILKNEEL